MAREGGRPGEVLAAFLRLGLTSFGGPTAHLGYFREAFVARRGWLDDAAYARLVALAQFLPGPASSQVGFAIGLHRAGWAGGLSAFVGFTLPSALLMTAFAFVAGALEGRLGQGLLHGLKLAAVAVVAQALLGMARSLCPDPPRAALAAAALVAVSAVPGPATQVGVIALAGALGAALRTDAGAAAGEPPPSTASARAGLVCLAAFALGLAATFGRWPDGLARLAAAFYRSGALVFGGGHVVLPLLRAAVVETGLVPEAAFLSAYGAAQALPGPLFSVAAALGGAAAGIAGAAVALIAIFAPGLLLMAGALPFWAALSGAAAARGAVAGVNAAVVGLLGAALYDPAFVGAVRTPFDFALAVAGFVALVAWRAPPIAVVAALSVAGALGALR